MWQGQNIGNGSLLSRRRESRVAWQSESRKNGAEGCTMVQKNQDSRRKYWVTCSSVHSFACTACSYACLALLRCAHSFTYLLAYSWACEKMNDSMYQNNVVLPLSGMLGRSSFTSLLPYKFLAKDVLFRFGLYWCLLALVRSGTTIRYNYTLCSNNSILCYPN